MKFVVTGGAGFLGSHLIERLIKDGNYVICIDNLITGSLQNISHLLGHSLFRFYDFDLCKEFDLKDDFDYMLHFASPASPKDYLKYPIETLKVGAIGTLNALELARNKRAKFIFASTSEVYGDPNISPQPESYWGNVNPVGVRSVYDEAKRFAEALIMSYHRKYGLDTRIARIFNTYGPRMRLDDGRVIPTFIWQALRKEPLTIFGSGQQTRSFCFVDDLIEGIMKLIKSEGVHTPVNLGNQEEFKIIDLAKKICKILKIEERFIFEPLPEDDPKQRRPDIAKAKELLGWEPSTNLDKGLKITIEWFKAFLGFEKRK